MRIESEQKLEMRLMATESLSMHSEVNLLAIYFSITFESFSEDIQTLTQSIQILLSALLRPNKHTIAPAISF